MAKKYNYNFIRKKSEGGGAAVRLATVSGGLFIIDAVISFAFGGKAGVYVGAVALFAMLTAVYGFYLGLRSFRETKVSHRQSVIGSVSCGVLAVLWLSLFLIGV